MRFEEYLDRAAHHLAQDVSVPISKVMRPNGRELRPCLLDADDELLGLQLEATPFAADVANGALHRGVFRARCVCVHPHRRPRLREQCPLQLSGGNKSHAASMLGLKRTTLIEKLRRRGKPSR